jgi:alanine-glyoxylate transaminase/serine-glyoxylate transaminase/serine-pyruvate transaminase
VRGALIKRHSIEVGGGLGDLRGKVWRVGLMGESSTEGNVLLFLSALGRILAEQGVQLDTRAGIATASERLRA